MGEGDWVTGGECGRGEEVAVGVSDVGACVVVFIEKG
jgi:hypothetical protein